MFCTVYRLYRHAERMPPEMARAGGVFGWLLITHRGTLSPQHELVARLYPTPKTEVELLIPELWFPTLKLVKEGILIAGHEAGPTAKVHQRWWCVPGPMDDGGRAS
ncbi:hypothetical protein J7E70_26505 [Variovorax paradoxus]|nr:hypothetical protein [Variovorax paradoxus]MBT2303996.1 hypothetical protein [Variovorax paradoxus]